MKNIVKDDIKIDDVKFLTIDRLTIFTRITAHRT